MTREAFIRKWLANKDFQYCEDGRAQMREDLDKVIDYHQTKQKLNIHGVMPRFIFKIMITNIFKNVFLGLFGVAVIAMGLTITSHFDEALKDDNFSLAYMSITWAAYITCKAYSEYGRSKNGA